MKRYLAVFTGSPGALAEWEKIPVEDRRKKEADGMAAWAQWGADHAAAVVETGGPLSRTRRVSKDGIGDIRNNLAAFTVVRAESHDAAAALFLNHPHFMIFPGDGVEIMEVLPIPAAG